MRIRSVYAVPVSLLALTAAACGDTGTSLEDLNKALAAQSSAPPAQASTAAPVMTSAAAAMTSAPAVTSAAPMPDPTGPATGSTPSADPSAAASEPAPEPSTTDTAPVPTDAPVTTEEMPPVPSATEMMPVPSASMEPEPVDMGPYAPRTGSFKMLIYPITKGFPHDSIPQGIQMLQSIAQEQGFETVTATDNSDITLEGLSKYEIVFFMNSTGDIFNPTEQQAYEDWMTTKNGAFGGTHSATDTENGWAFYSEVTGQYYDLHDNCCAEAQIQWQPEAANHVTVKGLPSPWTRAEEWYKFNKAASWSTKAGFTILSTVTTAGGGTRPVSFVREYGNFRSFYTSLGHQGSAFQDPNVKKHVTAGILWAVRREASIAQ